MNHRRLAVLLGALVSTALGCGGADSAQPPDGGAAVDASVDINVSPDAPEASIDVADAGADVPAEATADAGQDAADAPSDDADAATADAAVSLDPAPGDDAPGDYTCSGGPAFSDPDAGSAPVTTPNAALDLAGNVGGASGDGTYYVVGDDGSELVGAIPTDANGDWSVRIVLVCGEQTVKLVWGNDACKAVRVFRVTRTDCVQPDMQLTLTWDALGDDWELHLLRPGGHINDQAGGSDCTWTTCISSSPDWGVTGDTSDDPHKDVDNTGSHGPENIWLSKPEPGTYTVMVEHWGSGDPASPGQLVLNVAGTTTVLSKSALAPRHVWEAATITWPGGQVTPIGTDVDCTASWSGGCTMTLP